MAGSEAREREPLRPRAHPGPARGRLARRGVGLRDATPPRALGRGRVLRLARIPREHDAALVVSGGAASASPWGYVVVDAGQGGRGPA